MSWPQTLTPGSAQAIEAHNRRREAEAARDDGAALFDDVAAFLARFVVYPTDHARTAHTLWIGHAWLMDVWESTPRIAFLSPEPGSGKTRALEVSEPLVPRPVHAVNATPAALFRKVSEDPDRTPTILYDEIDTVFGPKAKDNEDIRGMLNAGHRRGATALRCVVKGKSVEIEELPAYCAVALAGLDDLPDTIATRSVIIRMRRRAPGETVEPWRLRAIGPEAESMHLRLEEWSGRVRSKAGRSWPEMPDGVEDRAADVWEALIAVADLAGGHWPSTARRSAVALVAAAATRPASLGVQLLTDIRTAFDRAGTDRLPTDELLEALTALDESPWGDLRGKPLDPRGLSRRLSKYDLHPKNIRLHTRIAKGYERADFTDAWARYLPPVAAPSLQSPGGSEEVEADLLRALTEPGTPSAPSASVTATSATPLRPQPEESATSATPLPLCTVCGNQLWSPQSRRLGVCGKTDDRHAAARTNLGDPS